MGGTIDKFIGDAVMASGRSGADDRSCRRPTAALAMSRAVRR